MKQAKNTFFRKFIMKTILFSLTLMMLFLTACGFEDKFVGVYEGTAGSYLKLEKDGVCIYGEDDETGVGKGVWYIENGMLYIEVSNLNYDLYAVVNDFNDEFLLEADSSYWNDEYFSKIKR